MSSTDAAPGSSVSFSSDAARPVSQPEKSDAARPVAQPEKSPEPLPPTIEKIVGAEEKVRRDNGTLIINGEQEKKALWMQATRDKDQDNCPKEVRRRWGKASRKEKHILFALCLLSIRTGAWRCCSRAS